ncbi:isopentenyl-diphosphate Delta-isomerase [Amycolatopsis magusensis]|uniref:isopentenyl-diphosphate Delta-isomerase n=1 Tax=Amycolatopsis magusensis TaxID=882444 RepID=UPI0037A5AD8A
MTEQVVLLDEQGHAIGVADKAGVHHRQTPLHLAFSAYAFNERGQFLLTRRAFGKRTFPGMWTNSCCGHPAPGEDMSDGIVRRLSQELGLTSIGIDLVLPEFQYRAEMDGVVENEKCPVWRVEVIGEPEPDPTEVDAYRWVEWNQLVREIEDGSQAISPWCREQLAELRTLGPDPLDWPSAEHTRLPPAALVSAQGR